MKLLFLTTYNISILQEHYFTKNVWNGLCAHFLHRPEDELCIASIFESVDIQQNTQFKVGELNKHTYYQLCYSSSLTADEKVKEISEFFSRIAPSVIHSNMIEAYDVQAAKILSLPIILTIHIGGFICPRGGGNGFLMYNNQICNRPVSDRCIRCCCQDLPFPGISYLLQRVTPSSLKMALENRIKNKNVFYFTPFLYKFVETLKRQKAIEVFKYATIVAANHHLCEILKLNGLDKNIVVLPHGVQERPHRAYPTMEGKIKLCYLGRIQHSKGLHILLKALKGIDPAKYELHIIGDAESDGISRRYNQKVHAMARGLNVVFYGRLPNSEIDEVLEQMHLMVHVTICLEVYGLTIAESLSIGRPVLATRCGGAEEQILDNFNGWLVAPNNVDELREKIKFLISDKDEIRKAAQNCKLPHPLPDYVSSLYDIYINKSLGE